MVLCRADRVMVGIASGTGRFNVASRRLAVLSNSDGKESTDNGMRRRVNVPQSRQLRAARAFRRIQSRPDDRSPQPPGQVLS
jgi:hypothetical protein